MIIWQKLKTCLMLPAVVTWLLTCARVYLGLIFGEGTLQMYKAGL